jgi:hypothetical protein
VALSGSGSRGAGSVAVLVVWSGDGTGGLRGVRVICNLLALISTESQSHHKTNERRATYYHIELACWTDSDRWDISFSRDLQSVWNVNQWLKSKFQFTYLDFFKTLPQTSQSPESSLVFMVRIKLESDRYLPRRHLVSRSTWVFLFWMRFRAGGHNNLVKSVGHVRHAYLSCEATQRADNIREVLSWLVSTIWHIFKKQISVLRRDRVLGSHQSKRSLIVRSHLLSVWFSFDSHLRLRRFLN